MQKEMKCPICQKHTDVSILAIEYKGELYAFCCPYCRERFVEAHDLGLDHSLEQNRSSGLKH